MSTFGFPEQLTVSFMMLTIDRFEITSKAWQHNMRTARHKVPQSVRFENLVCDNGSTDKRIVDFFISNGIHYHRVNKRNEGVSHSFNQLYLRSTGDVLVFMGNDIECDEGWLHEALRYCYGMPNCGIVGIDWGHGGVPPITCKLGVNAHHLSPQLNRVFGTWIVRRRVVEEIGLFHEGFGPYGIEDSDFNERVTRAGFHSLYMPHMRSRHLCNDVGQGTDYRKAKDQSLAKNCEIFNHRVTRFDVDGIREPLPPAREPLT
jgi:GT2 family glycosyltransferase